MEGVTEGAVGITGFVIPVFNVDNPFTVGKDREFGVPVTDPAGLVNVTVPDPNPRECVLKRSGNKIFN